MLVRYKTLFSKSFGKFVRSVKHDSSIFKLVRRNHLEIVHERFFVHFEKLSFFISLMDPSCSFIICFYVRSQNRCSSLILSNLGSRIQDLGSRIQDLGSRIYDPGSRIQDLGSRIQDLGSRVQNLESRIQDLGSRIQNLGSRIQDPGSRIKFHLEISVSLFI